MKKLTFKTTYADNFLGENFLSPIKKELEIAQEKIFAKTGAGSDFLGWVNLPSDYDQKELQQIKVAAKKIQKQSQTVVVLGIGGSYLGARAALEALRSPNYNQLEKKTPNIYFSGNTLSADAFAEIVAMIGQQDFSIIVISKSGTTTETAVAFRLFRKLLIDKYGRQEANQRIYAVTDKSKGVLKEMSNQEGYTTFVVPDDIGGRYSVLTAVGLLPLAIAGINLDDLLTGAQEAQKNLKKGNLQNPAWQYAGARQLLARKDKTMEVLSYYQPRFRQLSEWWKQLFGESEGKEQQGIFPASVELTTDLHSLGQYLQEGKRNLIETVLWCKKSQQTITIHEDKENLDKLSFLSGKTLDFINEQAFKATLNAHQEGGVPNFIVEIPEMNEWQLGYLFYFFEFSCALSAYLSGVNPFNQPGVEVYKQKMFKLLGKN
ncbi:MAG: glucose-6-phosphate isomerase [bacterium]|nr:glucose-6-phosphate isomerase [bacterium]